MTEEKYLIGNKEFCLRNDLNFNELDRVNEFTESWKAVDKKTISSKLNYTNAEVVDIVKMLLMPIDGSDKNDFDWKQLTPDQCVLILADFAKKKAIENVIMTKSSEIYRNAMQQQSNVMKN
ncbi:MAG: hypothetical protein FIA82_08150 [Melioribacter sp.]|nr:hypothetical protein [Melioribacter sp.]